MKPLVQAARTSRPRLSRPSPVLRLSAAVVALLGATLATVGLSPSAAAAYPAANVELRGHGYGHGRGMGQYGALGYALAGMPYTDILGHYYGGTVMGSIGDAIMTVRIVRHDNLDTIVYQTLGLATTSTHPGQVFGALLVRLDGPSTFDVYSGAGCGGPWSLIADNTGAVTLGSGAAETDDPDTMLQLCDAAGSRWYRGDLDVVDSGGQRTVNRLPMEAYLRGVVPRESPASWGALAGGMNALRAQAVAARSYAQVQNRYPGLAKTCDTETCQVYGGFAVQNAAGFRKLEEPATNAAIAETASQVRVFGNGAVASTEFSSSTGGHTAGGTFPAVVDAGDAVPQNPNHDWTTSIPVAAIEAAYTGIGQLKSVDVIRRNGLGDFGGRVLELVLVGTLGRQTITGDEFRLKFSLKSDWFLVTNNASGGVSGYWVVAADGGIFSFGSAQFWGSMGGKRLNAPVLGMAATRSGGGYWLVAADGGIFSFGDASFWGSTGSIRLNQPVVAMASSPTGNGYWLVARDGGIFAFGDAGFWGSTGSIRLNQPVIGMAASPTGNGYWLVAADGGIFAFGDAQYQGSLPAIRAPGPARGMQATASGGGYLVANDAGRVFAFGDAPFFGDVASGIPGYRGGVRGITARLTE